MDCMVILWIALGCSGVWMGLKPLGCPVLMVNCLILPLEFVLFTFPKMPGEQHISIITSLPNK